MDSRSGPPEVAGFRWAHRLRAAGIAVVLLGAVSLQPQSASAWPCRWRTSGWGFGLGPACVRPICGPFGYGYSSYSYRSFGWCSPGFSAWSFGPACGPASWGGFWPGVPACGWSPCGGYGGYGWYPCSPVILAPYSNCFPATFLPSAFAPVYGPAGVAPFLGISSATAPFNRSPTIVGNAVDLRRVAAGATAMPRVRASNALARLRAGRLVAVGDRHLKASVADPARLLPALDAYRRAATIAPDQPDTFLRQAIVLTALERPTDAGRAVNRAAAIDGRLAADAPAARVANGSAAMAADPPLAPDPVFGDRRVDEPATLAARSGEIMGRIFADDPARPAVGDNWIADRWSRQWPGFADKLAGK